MELSHPSYVLLLTGLGTLVLMTAWLPMLLRKAPLSLPTLCVAAGAMLFALPPLSPLRLSPATIPGPGGAAERARRHRFANGR